MNEKSKGASVTFAVRIESISDATAIELPDGTTIAAGISPGLIAVASTDNVLFRPGAMAADTGLEQLAEDGNPHPLLTVLQIKRGVKITEFLIPNLHYRVTAEPGDKLYFAVMFVHSNDLFYAFGPTGLPLFDDYGNPVSGDVTRFVDLWDAGTEVNERPGVGPNQAPRQVAPNAGQEESNPVRLISEVNDGYTYPPTDKVIRVTVTPL